MTVKLAIQVGDRVTVRFESGNVYAFLIVERNGNPESGTISSRSPLGKALLGHQTGERVSYEVQGRLMRIEITSY